MKLHFLLDVKFRAAGIDFGHISIDRAYTLPVPIPDQKPHTIDRYSNRGVTFLLELVAA